MYLGGVVSYANAVKEAQLGVRAETLRAHGAVSEETAREMVQGVASRFGADVAIAVTGIAGPGGGSPDKPVGTVWFAWFVEGRVEAERIGFAGDRFITLGKCHRHAPSTSTPMLRALPAIVLIAASRSAAKSWTIRSGWWPSQPPARNRTFFMDFEVKA